MAASRRVLAPAGAVVAAAFAFFFLVSFSSRVSSVRGDDVDVSSSPSFVSRIRSRRHREERERERLRSQEERPPLLLLLRRGDDGDPTGRTRGATEEEEEEERNVVDWWSSLVGVVVDPAVPPSEEEEFGVSTPFTSSRTTTQRGLAKKHKGKNPKKHDSTSAPTLSPTEEPWTSSSDHDEEETSSTTSEDEDDEDEDEETTTTSEDEDEEDETEESEEEPEEEGDDTTAEKNAIEEEEESEEEETDSPTAGSTSKPVVAATPSPTVAPTPSPTKHPAKPYSSTVVEGTNEEEEEEESEEDTDDPVKSEEHENKWDDGSQSEFERGEVQEEAKAKKLGGVAIVFVVCLLIFTAQQMSDNPDGIYASICRLAITISGIIIKIALMPCRYLFGNRWLFLGGGSHGGHQPISTVDYREPYRGRHGHVELS